MKNIYIDIPEIKELDQNKILMPSFVDVHVHLREPGFTYKETIKTGTMAAMSHGYAWLMTMPNLNPVPDCYDNLKVQLDTIKKDASINVIPYGAITEAEKGLKLANLVDMADYVKAYSDDGVGLNDESLMREAMIMAKKLDKIIVAHCEDLKLRDGGYIHDGEYAKKHHHKGISSKSEYLPIQRDLKIVQETGCKYHVCHISTKESVELIRKAKEAGLDVTCETAPHYLVLSDEDLKEDGCFKMNPPLRSKEDQLALIEGIKNGTIDMIATDHAPHSEEEKSRGLENSAMGIVGLETAFPILYTKLVKTGIITVEDLIRLMSTNPRKRFGLPSAEENGDYAIWNIDEAYRIDASKFYSKGKSSPFINETVYGKCILNVVNNKIVWKAQ